MIYGSTPDSGDLVNYTGKDISERQFSWGFHDVLEMDEVGARLIQHRKQEREAVWVDSPRPPETPLTINGRLIVRIVTNDEWDDYGADMEANPCRWFVLCLLFCVCCSVSVVLCLLFSAANDCFF